jgi:MFS family permease
VLVFPKLFFPAADAPRPLLQSLATFAIAFFARPVGSAVFGHFGDRIGRKATLVAALLTMGVSTVAIGLLPTYASDRHAGAAAAGAVPLRPGPGPGRRVGRGGAARHRERTAGQARLVRHVPAAGRAARLLPVRPASSWCCPQTLSDADFFSLGLARPFLASALLVIVGLYVRLKITETPDFQAALERNERVRLPVAAVFRIPRALVLGTLAALATFVIFYLMTVFALSWGTTALGYSRQQFLLLQLFAHPVLRPGIPLSAVLADRLGTGAA